MLESHEKWIGPFQIRDLLEFSLKESHIPQPPDSGSTYLVSKHSWQTHPSADSEALYIGGNTGRSARFRTRMGDLLADALGFFTNETGHHSGGQNIHRWCLANDINPLDLYIAWVDGSECHRCLENRTYRDLNPALNRVVPAKCTAHG